MKDLALNAQRAKNRVFQALAPVQMVTRANESVGFNALTHYK